MHPTRMIPALALGAVLLSMAATVPGAMAQNYNPRDAVSSRYGAMSCAAFTRLGTAARADIVRRMIGSAPPRSLASVTITPNPGRNGRLRLNDQSGESAVPGTPLTVGQLIAACQAASPRATLKEAYVQFNSGRGILRKGR